MNLGQSLRQSYRVFQQSWARRADAAFGKSVPSVHDEMCRGEFISALISDQGQALAPKAKAKTAPPGPR